MVVQVGGMTYKKTIMKNLLKKIKSCFSKKEVTLDPNSIENVILTTVNTIIQSPEIQGMTFKVSSSCDKTSVLNDIEFCNEVYVHDKYTWSVVDDACITACDVAYDLCHAGCSTIDWTCNNCCTKECKKGRDGCKSLCGYLDMTGGYEFRLTSIKGVGKLTAYRVLALMPNVSCFQSAKQFAAYIGITPKQHQSGKFIGKTTISRLGDSRLRKALYMAALVAKRHNKGLAAFVLRLQQNGKTPKTIVCAVMRKLAHIIFGVLKSGMPFNENFSCI